MHKYKRGTPDYLVYDKVYSRHFFSGWVCITLFLLLSLAFDSYRAMHTPPPFVIFLGSISLVLTLLLGLYLCSTTLKRK